MKPILCNTQVVKNLLDGSQTQDRRPCKYQPQERHQTVKRFGKEQLTAWIRHHHPRQVGDILYVRETWKYIGTSYTAGPAHHGDDPKRTQATVQYRAYGEYKTIKNSTDSLEWPIYKPSYSREGWLPNIHMPKWAARTFLEVTEVRCEQIRSISWQDCHKEGISFFRRESCEAPNFVDAFRDLWESIYPGTWDKNIWVWVTKFKKIEKPS